MPETPDATSQGEAQTDPVVSQDVTSEPVQEPTAGEPVAPGTDQPPKGYVPYADLKKERERRRDAEAKLENLESPTATGSVEPANQSQLEREVRELKLDKLVGQHGLEEHRAELEEYLDSNSNLSLEQGVNLFRVEQGLIASKPEPQGLETPTAGPKTAPKPKYSLEEIDNLRRNNTQEYQRLLLAGAFDNT